MKNSTYRDSSDFFHDDDFEDRGTSSSLATSSNSSTSNQSFHPSRFSESGQKRKQPERHSHQTFLYERGNDGMLAESFSGRESPERHHKQVKKGKNSTTSKNQPRRPVLIVDDEVFFPHRTIDSEYRPLEPPAAIEPNLRAIALSELKQTPPGREAFHFVMQVTSTEVIHKILNDYNVEFGIILKFEKRIKNKISWYSVISTPNRTEMSWLIHICEAETRGRVLAYSLLHQEEDLEYHYSQTEERTATILSRDRWEPLLVRILDPGILQNETIYVTAEERLIFHWTFKGKPRIFHIDMWYRMGAVVARIFKDENRQLRNTGFVCFRHERHDIDNDPVSISVTYDDEELVFELKRGRTDQETCKCLGLVFNQSHRFSNRFR